MRLIPERVSAPVSHERENAMDYGIPCLASVDSWKDVAFAETNGFMHAWIADSQMVWADPY